MIRLTYNNKAFKILNGFDVTTNNSEVTFNDITIDFTSYGLADMPLKYQEIKIKECYEDEDILTQGRVLFFGYVDTIELGKMQMSQEHRELNITLLSPLKLATVRTTTVKGTYNVSDVIPLILEPLINDGYTIEELNVVDSQITVNYVMQNIEYCMNDLAKRKDIFWTIDENKDIYINSLENLFSRDFKREITNTSDEDGLLKIAPIIEDTDYANVINIKNARILYHVGSYEGYHAQFEQLSLPKRIKNGDIIEFNYPFTISPEYLKRIKEEVSQENLDIIPILRLGIGSTFYKIEYNLTTEEITYTGSITFSDDDGDEGDIVLQRDNFFSNLITGFKWNGSNAQIGLIESYSALRFTKVKFMNTQEIEKLKGVISESGQIEKTVDANETWFTSLSLLDYAKTLMTQNTNEINTIVLEYDENYGFEIGDLLKINLPQFYCEGIYAITQIRFSYVNKMQKKWEITLKKSDLMSSYIDLFRKNAEDKDDEKEESLLIAEYAVEGLNEIHNIIEVEE